MVRFEESVSDDARLHLTWAAGDHIAHALRGVPGLVVASPGTVSRAWSESGGRVDELARALGAHFIVTGSSAMRGNEAEITVTLWHAAADATRWSETFTFPSISLRQIEDSSVARITSYLGVRANVRTDRVVPSGSYEALARGDYFLRRPGTVAIDSARAAYQRAVAGDPSSALAKARLARAYAVSLTRSGRVARLALDRAVAHGLALADSALRLDPRLAEAATARAMLLRFQDPRRLTGAIEAHEKAVSIAPQDADAQHEYGETLLLLANERAALDRFRRALTIEPNRAETLRAYGELEMLARRYTPSCALLNASVGADEYDAFTYALRAQVRLQLGEFRDAYSDSEIASRLGGERWGDALTVMVLAAARDVERARRETRQLADSWLRGEVPLGVREARYLGAALFLTGDADRAIVTLSRARPQGAEFRSALRDPVFDRLRSDARFRRLVVQAPAESTSGADR